MTKSIGSEAQISKTNGNSQINSMKIRYFESKKSQNLFLIKYAIDLLFSIY